MAEVKLDLPPDLLKLLEGMGDVQRAIKECIVLELYRRGTFSEGTPTGVPNLNRNSVGREPDPISVNH